LRKGRPVIASGTFTMLNVDDAQVFAYLREDGSDHVLVVANWSNESRSFAPETDLPKTAEILLSNYQDSPAIASAFELRPWEAIAYHW